MAKATWKGVVVAEGESYEMVEGNVYFSPDAVHRQFLRPSDHHTDCPWKGKASYAHLEVNGQVNENAAWFYPSPKEGAQHIRDHVAFWKGVTIEK